MAKATLITQLAHELHGAFIARRTVRPLRLRGLELSIDDAYAISLGILARRRQAGEIVVGKKIGVTSKAVQDMLGVHQPDFGFLTDAMRIDSGSAIDAAATMIQPRVEAEIALILKSPLKGPGVTPADVRAATSLVAPCFEIVDSRIDGWDIGIIDTIADNASCGMFVLGPAVRFNDGFDLALTQATVWKNGRFLSEGRGSAVQGSPLASVAWLANTLGAYGVTLEAEDIILSGSLVPLEAAVAGDHFEMELAGIGGASVRFA